MRRSSFAYALPVFLALGATGASCNLVLGLDEFIDCPEDPKCKALVGTGGATTTGGTGGSGGVVPDPTCTDGVKNGGESDVDCGGAVCDRCADDKGCSNGGDCESKVCTGGTCIAPSCTDSVENGGETDQDCGGGSCPGCGVDKGCVVDGDCAGGSCVGGVCAATCTDGVKDGDESDVDCGGATCGKCGIDDGCGTGVDCETGVCQGLKCVSYHVWSKQFGDSAGQSGNAVASDPLGNTYLFSSVSGTTDFGGGPIATSGATAVAKFGPTGTHIWSKAFNTGVSIRNAAADLNGNVFFSGTAANGTDLGGGALSGLGSLNLFVAKLSTGGTHVFSKMFPLGKDASLAVNKLITGFVVVGSVFGTNLDFGCGNLPAVGAGDIAIARFGFQNNCTWSKRFGNMSTDPNSASAITVDEADNIFVAGKFVDTLDFGCGAVTSAPGVFGDIFVTKFDSSGTCVWTKSFTDPMNGGNGDYALRGISVDSMGRIALAGHFGGSLAFGSITLVAQGTYDIFAAQLDGSGAVTWAKSFGLPGSYNTLSAFAAATDGHIALAGAVVPGTDFGGGPLPTGEAFTAELDANGSHVWSRDFLSVDASSVNGLAYAGANNLVVTGGFLGQIDFGGPQTMTTMGGFDIFLAKLLLP